MTRKQRKMLYRILAAAGMTVILALMQPEGLLQLLWMLPYLTAGYDILLGALHGIRSRDPFDENFLMAVATVGAVLLGEYQEAVAVRIRSKRRQIRILHICRGFSGREPSVQDRDQGTEERRSESRFRKAAEADYRTGLAHHRNES